MTDVVRKKVKPQRPPRTQKEGKDKLQLLCTLLAALTVVLCTPTYDKIKLSPIRGATVAHVHNRGKGYGSGVTRKLYQHIKEKGYNAIQLNSFAYQKNLADPHLFWNDPTLRQKDLEREIGIIQSFGLKVMLKPHIWVTDEIRPTVWRSAIDYKKQEEIDLWFEEYARFLKWQVLLAARKQVDFFVIGTELVKLSRYREHWQELIGKIRQWGYKGALSYACEAWNAKNILFWDHLDAIGINFYYGYDKKKEGRPTRRELENFYSEKLLEHILHAKRYNLPLMFTEVGFPSHKYAIHKPASWGEKNMKSDENIQVKAYIALARAMAKTSYPYGIWFWKYVTTLESYEAENYSTGFILQNKRAEKIVSKMLQGKMLGEN